MINFLIQFGIKELVMGIGLVLLLVLFILHLSSSSSRKVKQSKKIISSVLKSSIKGKHYVLENVPLISKDGNEYNIDNILINRNGIYLFESKVYAGCLYIQGNKDDETWTRVFENKAKNQSIPNPVKEVSEYKLILKEIIPEDIPMFGYIVLLANTINDTDCNNIIYSYNIERIANEEKEVILSDEQIEEVYQKLLTLTKKEEN